MPSTVFFTEQDLAGMLQSLGRPASVCNMAFITMAAQASEGFLSRLGVNVGVNTYTQFLPMMGGVTSGSSEYLNEYVNRRATFSEIPIGPENGQLTLERTPVRSVTSVWLNLAAWLQGTDGGDWPDANLLPAGTYTMDWKQPGLCTTGILIRRIGSWPSEPRTVKVIYTAGYSTAELLAKYPELPSSLRYAIMQWLARKKVSERMASGLNGQAFSIEDFSVSQGMSTGNMSGMMAGAPGLPAIVLPTDILVALAGETNLAKYLPN